MQKKQKIVETLIILTKNLIVILLAVYSFHIRFKQGNNNYNTSGDIHSNHNNFNVNINAKQQYF